MHPARRTWPRAAAVTAGAAGLALTAAAPVAGTLTASAHDPAFPRTVARPAVAGHQLVRAVGSPLSVEECRTKWKIACYTPPQYREAYDLDPLYEAGITGKGRTIVIVDSFGSPTVQHDLDVYSRQFGIPGTKVQVVKWGNVPKWDPKKADMLGWAGETTLDVEMAHAVAPDAKIVLVGTAVGETEGTIGLPEMMDAEKALIDRGIGDVITQSFGATENTFPGFDRGDFSAIGKLRYAFEAAARNHVTVLASSGDGGAWLYSSYDPAATGWDVSGGTSEAGPLFAGIVALADQAAGKRLGDIHEALYRLYGRSAYDRSTGIVDVNDGTNNGYQGVTGYTAVNGYDMATGVGTLDAARFVPALAREGRRG
ncbi:protease [Streptomyces sp. NPDC001717]|uniref:S53 family peptidase n=1 Tax=Streptomyces sp. NPDC001717 TaxID=3364604 RepID=UPI0036AB8A4F